MKKKQLQYFLFALFILPVMSFAAENPQPFIKNTNNNIIKIQITNSIGKMKKQFSRLLCANGSKTCLVNSNSTMMFQRTNPQGSGKYQFYYLNGHVNLTQKNRSCNVEFITVPLLSNQEVFQFLIPNASFTSCTAMGISASNSEILVQQ